MSLSDIIVDANHQGWRVGSLCQLGERDWYACMIDSAEFAHTGTGATPGQAILLAMERPPIGRLYDPTRIAQQKEPQDTEEQIDLFALGLLHRRETIRRRRI